MPRVNINKKKYTENDLYKFIKVQMLLFDMNQTDLGKVLGESQQVISKRLKQHTLTIQNLISLFDYWQIDEETAGKVMRGSWKA